MQCFISFKDREGARLAKENCGKFQFLGRTLYANFCEPKESRQLAIEEKLDKKAYESHISRHMSSKSSDLVSLITSLGLILSQLNLNSRP
jgi:hypothetical protein